MIHRLLKLFGIAHVLVLLVFFFCLETSFEQLPSNHQLIRCTEGCACVHDEAVSTNTWRYKCFVSLCNRVFFFFFSVNTNFLTLYSFFSVVSRKIFEDLSRECFVKIIFLVSSWFSGIIYCNNLYKMLHQFSIYYLKF